MSTESYAFHGQLKSFTPASGALTVAMTLLAIAVIIVAGSWALTDPTAVVQMFDGIVAP